MHIALIISSLETGGAERVLSELANFWSSQGHNVSLITLSSQNSPSLYPLDSKIRLIQLNQLSSGNLSFVVRVKNIVNRIVKIRKAVKAVKPDVVVSFVDIMNITTLLASLGLKIPVIVSERTHPAYYQLPLFYKKLRRFVYPWANKVICQTASVSDYFSWLPGHKKAVIPNHVKRAMVEKKEGDVLRPVHQIVSVGRLCKNKGFQTLILAFSEIASQNEHLKLLIYGEGAMRSSLENLIQEIKLTGRVFLSGAVKDIEAALYKADLFVFPSHYEGFPNALCEAMSIGLPVIASNCSGTIDIIRDGVDGRLFPVGDVHRLTALLKELIGDSLQRVMLSKGALSLPDRFSEVSVFKLWDEVVAQAVLRKMQGRGSQWGCPDR